MVVGTADDVIQTILWSQAVLRRLAVHGSLVITRGIAIPANLHADIPCGRLAGFDIGSRSEHVG